MCRRQLSRRGETSNMSPRATSLTVRSPVRKDRAKQAVTQRGRSSEHIHSRKAGANTEKDPGFVKQDPPPCLQTEEEPCAAL